MSDATALEPSAAPTAPAAPTGPLADLILVRLLPARKSVGLKDLRKDIAPLFRDPPSSEQVCDTVASLRAAGLVTPKGQLLTASGRARAVEYLGVTELPGANWGTVKARYLVPKAMGLSPDSDEAKATADAKKLAALLLRKKFDLPEETPLTLAGVLNALAYQELGFQPPRDPKPGDFRAAIISRKLQADSPLTGKHLEKDGAKLLLGAKTGGAEGLRALVLAGWVDRPGRRVESEPFDLEAFADTVKAVARHCPTGRFGDNKVFVRHVWAQLKGEPRFAPLGIDGFKEKLVEAHRQDLLTLSRADLVQLMDPTDVRESEVAYLNAVFHFVLIERE